MLSRHLLTLTISFILALSLTLPSYASNAPEIDRVIVSKSDRQLYLMQGRSVVKAYPVSLGKNPLGHKLQKGDKRTPEGRYILDWRNPQSRYHLALHISYPSINDKKAAARKGVTPGGNIMIHGLPSKYADGERVMLDIDWTDGCIAVSNDAIEEIWQLVADNTVIDIFP
jgi:murein L,D-transpeptidase YafK